MQSHPAPRHRIPPTGCVHVLALGWEICCFGKAVRIIAFTPCVKWPWTYGNICVS